MGEAESELIMGARHLAEGRRIVARQRERIAKLKALGRCTQDDELTLGVFVSTLDMLGGHARALEQAAKRLDRPRPLLSWPLAPAGRP